VRLTPKNPATQTKKREKYFKKALEKQTTYIPQPTPQRGTVKSPVLPSEYIFTQTEKGNMRTVFPPVPF
jgi:hypothetical protein